MTTTALAPVSSPHGKQVLDDLSPLHRQLRRCEFAPQEDGTPNG